MTNNVKICKALSIIICKIYSIIHNAITLTNKSEQYINIISSFLSNFNDLEYDHSKLQDIINIFNSVNGEWLLNILSSSQNYTRSKLSEIVSIKYSLAYLETENILWAPISLEEILRIASVSGLKKSEGLFSAKNLNESGKCSDDILLIGVDYSKKELEVILYPIEVKVGSNQIKKAKEQVNKTYDILEKYLRFEINNEKEVFLNQFYRNFFLQIYISNCNKLINLGIYDSTKKEILNKIKTKLANDNFDFKKDLKKYIGKAAILSFEKDLTFTSRNIEDELNILRFSEKHVYEGLINSITEIRRKLLHDEYDIKSDSLLSEQMKNTYDGEEITTTDKENINKESIEEYMDVNDVRVLIGQVKGSHKKIFWEYGHPELPNRHLLISGKSGQGKTYLIQTILYELSKNSMPCLVIDYTDGFKNSQLENQFRERIGEKLVQHYVIRDKININPFKINDIVLDENEFQKEKPSDVADRITSVIQTIYSSLGIQQKNTIYNAIKLGIEKYGEKMDFNILKNLLIEDESSYSDTALGQLNSFIDKDIFSNNHNFDWKEIEQNDGKINIIQLSGFSQDIQLLITEFLLWDLWYYKRQLGTEKKPLSIVIDEAQNLDHSSDSPTAKILTEGRKFGFSGIFSTQFLKGQLKNDEISRLEMASQKIYFKPPDNEMNSIASDFDDRSIWKRKMKNLSKGKCIFKGPLVNEKNELQSSQSIILDVTSFSKRD